MPANEAAAVDLAEFNRVKDCRHGRMIYNINDIYIGRSLDIYGEYSEGEIEMFCQIVRPNDVVVDVGANIGAHTVYLARAVQPNGYVFAFEPQRLSYQTLCGNIAINSFTHVMCINSAVGDRPGSVRVPLANPRIRNNFGGMYVEGHASGEPVSVVTLDSFNLPACRLLKIDVEGMELKVLQGAAKTIERCKPAIYLEDDRSENSAPLQRYLDQLGYAMFMHRPPLFNPNNFFKNPENVFGDVVSGNLLCLHKSQSAQIQGMQQVMPPAA